MKKNQITFGGVDYPTRTLFADGEEITISTLNLYDALHPNEWGTENDGFASKRAEEIDNGIFAYVDADEINLPFEDLKKILKESNPDFEFTERADKVYVVVTEVVESYYDDRRMRVFANIKDAEDYFRSEVAETKSEDESNGCVIEETSVAYSAWIDGEYGEDHINIRLEEYEVEGI